MTTPTPAASPLRTAAPALLGSGFAFSTLTLQEAIEQLIELHPDNADILGEAKTKIRNRDRATPQHKATVITRHLSEGVTTIAELVEETGWSKGDIMTELLHLIDAKIVEERDCHPARRNVGRGGKTRYYFLANTASFSAMIGGPAADQESDNE